MSLNSKTDHYFFDTLHCFLPRTSSKVVKWLYYQQDMRRLIKCYYQMLIIIKGSTVNDLTWEKIMSLCLNVVEFNFHRRGKKMQFNDIQSAVLFNFTEKGWIFIHRGSLFNVNDREKVKNKKFWAAFFKCPSSPSEMGQSWETQRRLWGSNGRTAELVLHMNGVIYVPIFCSWPKPILPHFLHHQILVWLIPQSLDVAPHWTN